MTVEPGASWKIVVLMGSGGLEERICGLGHTSRLSNQVCVALRTVTPATQRSVHSTATIAFSMQRTHPSST